MKLTKSSIVATMAMFGILAAVGAAWATAGSSGNGQTRVATARRASARMSLRVFRSSFAPTRRQRHERAEIAREFSHAPRGAAVATADFSDARPVPIPGQSGDVWVSPDANGGVCTFIPDPLDGYGAACATLDAVNADDDITMLGGGTVGPLTDSAIVAIVEPNGAAPPRVIGSDGSSSTLTIASNVAVAVVKQGDTIVSGANSRIVPDLRPPECAPPVAGAEFRRCAS